MIGYVFLTVGVLATAVVIYAVAPAGRGLHRFVVPRSRLRRELRLTLLELAGAEEHIAGLESALSAGTSSWEWMAGQLTAAEEALEKAQRQHAELEEQLREVDQLRVTNTALQAQLANANAIRPLTVAAAPPPRGPRVVALHQAPLATGPAHEPSTPEPPAAVGPPAPAAGPNQQGDQPCSKMEAASSATRSSGSSPSPSAPSSPSSPSVASAG
uniref:hypothetical protein n=1 Tax=Streptomyces scabiei TaxID=1930 RepID=UPI0013C4063F|nr:hypothetical protein [Streptomyces scabiei]